MADSDELTLTLPRERDYRRIAHLVLGGLGVRLDLTVETLDDLQLALGTILDRVEPGKPITITLSTGEGAIAADVGPVDLRRELAGSDDLGLKHVLLTLVDDVEVDDQRVRLTKQLDG